MRWDVVLVVRVGLVLAPVVLTRLVQVRAQVPAEQREPAADGGVHGEDALNVPEHPPVGGRGDQLGLRVGQVGDAGRHAVGPPLLSHRSVLSARGGVLVAVRASWGVQGVTEDAAGAGRLRVHAELPAVAGDAGLLLLFDGVRLHLFDGRFERVPLGLGLLGAMVHGARGRVAAARLRLARGLPTGAALVLVGLKRVLLGALALLEERGTHGTGSIGEGGRTRQAGRLARRDKRSADLGLTLIAVAAQTVPLGA